MASRADVGPVLKWAGGKRQLLSQILERLPARVKTYYEPFSGGAAVFFELARQGRFERAVLSDRNPELIALYQSLKKDVEGLIAKLRRMPHSEEAYYRIRAQNPRTDLGRAARLIYLNKTGYNGLYRVNSRGEFNVPFGRYVNPNICDEARLRAAAQALRSVTIKVADFEEVCAEAKPGDAVYLDPPYLPVSRTASFASYQRDGFGIEEHTRLARVLGELGKRGVAALLSNSDTEATRRIFAAFSIETVSAARSINSNGARRGPVSEILVSPSLARKFSEATPRRARA